MARNDLLFWKSKIRFHNFSGVERKNNQGKIVNREGQRNFSIIIEDDAQAEQMMAEGFDIKKTFFNDDEFEYRLQVHIRYDKFPPEQILYISNSTGKTKELTEETIDCLDRCDITECDLTVNPYHYTVNDKSGIKAYLRAGFFKVNVNPMIEKYAEMESPEE